MTKFVPPFGVDFRTAIIATVSTFVVNKGHLVDESRLAEVHCGGSAVLE